ncbi:ankyrin repeat domain-containing protein [Microbulbifer sp. ANSA003]|uniref:ankyrin repeat domain-containing protein n=1 Tax=Microbulbifer sp. ANSA003 TaxID=3243360 RepID=UPI00404335B9
MSQVTSRDVTRAIFKGDIESLESFIASGFDITRETEKEKWSFLHMATQSVTLPINTESLKFLLSKKVGINNQDVYGNTALHYAARNRHEQAIEILLSAGADVQLKNKDGITPLHQTLLQKPFSLSATELLLVAGSETIELTNYVNTISHGEDSNVKELFAKYQ